MAKLSLNKSASYAGKAKADLLKALKSNDPEKKLSGEKNAKGHWEIDTSELDRVFSKKTSEPIQTGSKNHLATPENSNTTSALEVEVKLLREMLEKTELDRDKWQAIADKQTDTVKVLTHKQDEKPRLGVFQRIGAVFTG